MTGPSGFSRAERLWSSGWGTCEGDERPRPLDLAVTSGTTDGRVIRELLIDALTEDPDGDWFSFRVKEPVALAVDDGGRGAWRFSVEAWLAGKSFAGIQVDVAARAEELAVTEQLKLPGSLSFADIPARSIEAVERRQHFAEKLHALTRDWVFHTSATARSRTSRGCLEDRAISPSST